MEELNTLDLDHVEFFLSTKTQEQNSGPLDYILDSPVIRGPLTLCDDKSWTWSPRAKGRKGWHQEVCGPASLKTQFLSPLLEESAGLTGHLRGVYRT